MAEPVTNPEVGLQDNPPDVQIDIGTIQFDDTDAKYALDVQGDGLYTDTLIRNRFEKDHHKYLLPLASPNGFQNRSAAIVQLAAPTLVWISEWTIAKLNSKPAVPNPESQNPKWHLISAGPSIGESYELPSLMLAPDGTSILYRVSGVYVYGCTNPAQTTLEDMNWPRPPWIQDDFDRGLSNSLLTPNLIDTDGQINLNQFIVTAPGVP
jgi:hypothetical protein